MSGVYLHLFHGRNDVAEEMEGWGFDGPTLGPEGNRMQSEPVTGSPAGDPELWHPLAGAFTCPFCGYDGTEPPPVLDEPFRLTERVVRTWPIALRSGTDGTPEIVADAADDEIDWESSADTKIECGSCFEEFPVPENFAVVWE